MSQVLKFLDTALPKDSLSGLDGPGPALRPASCNWAAGRGVALGCEGQLCTSGGVLPKDVVPTPHPNPSPVFYLFSSPSSQSTSLGGQLPEPGAFHRGSPYRTGFMFHGSRTWRRAAKGPGPPRKHPSLAKGHYPPTCPAIWAPNCNAPAWFGQDCTHLGMSQADIALRVMLPGAQAPEMPSPFAGAPSGGRLQADSPRCFHICLGHDSGASAISALVRKWRPPPYANREAWAAENRPQE